MQHVRRIFGEPLFRTEGEVRDLAFNSRGEVCSIEEHGLLQYWSNDGHLICTHHLGDLEMIWKIGPDTRRLASGSADLTLWDGESGAEIERLPRESWVTCIAFSNDGKLLAAGHDDGMISIHDAATLGTRRTLAAHPSPVSTLAFSANGQTLASAGEDRVIHVFSTAKGNRLTTLTGHPDRIPALVWHPHENWLVSAGWDTSARVWEPPNPDPLMLLNSHSAQVNAIAFSPDGRFFVCADSDFNLHVWDDPRTAIVRHVLSGHRDEILCLAFSPDSRLLASAGSDGVIHLWDPIAGRHLAGSDSPHPHAITIIPTSKPRLISVASSRLRAYDLQTGEAVPEPFDPGQVLTVAASPDGRRLVTTGLTPEMRVWDTETDHSLVRICSHTRGPITSVAFAADSRHVATTSAADGLVWVWDLEQEEAILVIPEAADACTLEAIAFHPDGSRIAVGGIDWLATGGSDGATCIWDIGQRDRVFLFEDGVSCLAFSPDGTKLAGGSLRKSVLIWDLTSEEGEGDHEIDNHQQTVTAVAFSPDGQWLVIAGEDRVLRVASVETGEIASVTLIEAVAQSMVFTPDGSSLLTADAATTIHEIDFRELLPSNLSVPVNPSRANPPDEMSDPVPGTSDAVQVDLTGKVLGDFHLIRPLGQGGMGQVYLARQLTLNRQVAVKVLRSDLAANESALLRFKAEAEAVARLTHPNIVQIYSVGRETIESDVIHFMALEYVEGRNLREYLSKKGPPEVPLAIHIMRQVASALQQAGEMGLVHRDIKPENILLTRKNAVKVADFGLSRCFTETPAVSITQSGMTMGTPLYMSPEQVQGQPLDPRSDIYSFGVTCYHMLGGSPPFRGETPFAVALQHVQQTPRPLRDSRPDVPASLCAIIERMMAKEPAQRYQTAREILRDLTRLRESHTAMPAIVTPESPPAPPRSNRRWPLVGVGLGLFVLAIVLGGTLSRLEWMTDAPHFTPTSEETRPSARVVLDSGEETSGVPDPISTARHRSTIDRLSQAIQLAQRGELDAAEKIIATLPTRAPGQIHPRLFGQAMLEAYQDQPKESMAHFQESFEDRTGSFNEKAIITFLRQQPGFQQPFADALRRNRENLKASGEWSGGEFEKFIYPPLIRN